MGKKSSSLSPEGFGASTTGAEVAAHFHDRIVGKTVLVTGGSAGLGLETVCCFAEQGAQVYFTSRTKERAKAAKATIKARGRGKAVVVDLASLASVRACAHRLAELLAGAQLDILVLNAGYMGGWAETEDGLEMHFGCNYIGHYLLARLVPAKRVVVLSSVAHMAFVGDDGIDYSTLMAKDAKKKFSMFHMYGRSKYANVLMTMQLDCCLAVHPGAVGTTDLFKQWGPREIFNLVKNHRRTRKYIDPVRSIAAGTSTTIYCSVCDLPEGAQTGKKKEGSDTTTSSADDDDEESAKRKKGQSEGVVLYYSDCQLSPAHPSLTREHALALQQWADDFIAQH